jgi:hypothetical protein
MFGIAVWRPFTFPKIACFDIDKNEEIDFTFDGATITLPIAQKNLDIVLNYEYNPFSSFQFLQSLSFILYDYIWQSWFFSCPAMKIDDIVFNVADEFYFFSNISVQNKGKIKIHRRDITMLALLKECYDNIRFDIDETTVNLFLLKPDSMNFNINGIEGRAFISKRKDEHWIEKTTNKITQTINNITNALPKKAKKYFNIIEAGFNMERAAFGTALKINKDAFTIIIDTSFWNDHCFIHELLHCFIQHETKKADSAKLLFEESIIEYLSVYYYYGNQKDSIFNIKSAKVNEFSNTSIFSTLKNRMDTATGDGDYKVVYNKTPVIIRQFAEKIGGDEVFIDLLFRYYYAIGNDMDVSFDDMRNFFLTNGITQEDWKWFEENL